MLAFKINEEALKVLLNNSLRQVGARVFVNRLTEDIESLTHEIDEREQQLLALKRMRIAMMKKIIEVS